MAAASSPVTAHQYAAFSNDDKIKYQTSLEYSALDKIIEQHSVIIRYLEKIKSETKDSSVKELLEDILVGLRVTAYNLTKMYIVTKETRERYDRVGPATASSSDEDPVPPAAAAAAAATVSSSDEDPTAAAASSSRTLVKKNVRSNGITPARDLLRTAAATHTGTVKGDFDTAIREHVYTTSLEETMNKIRRMLRSFNMYLNYEINKYAKNPIFARKLTERQLEFAGRLNGIIEEIKKQIVKIDTAKSKTPGIMGSIGGFFGMSSSRTRKYRTRKYRNKSKKTRRSSRSRKSCR